MLSRTERERDLLLLREYRREGEKIRENRVWRGTVQAGAVEESFL